MVPIITSRYCCVWQSIASMYRSHPERAVNGVDGFLAPHRGTEHLCTVFHGRCPGTTFMPSLRDGILLIFIFLVAAHRGA
jgi:hypothetical protein